VGFGVVAAYTVPAVLVWMLIGAVLTSLPLAVFGLAGAIGYGCYYGLIELTGARGLPAPGRRWQVPQTMLINVSPRRRVLVWGAILGPGLVTRNPYAGFGVLPLALAAMRLDGPGLTGLGLTGLGLTGLGLSTAGIPAGLALGAAIGVAHGGARAIALLRDVRELRGEAPVASAPLAAAASGATAQLELLLKTIYWRRLDGVALLAVAAIAIAALSVRYF
jgi:hypothetical protein